MRGLDEIVNTLLRKALRPPTRNVWPAVPEPHPRVEVLHQTVAALKQGYEQLIRSRGDQRHSALLVGEFDNFAQLLRDTAAEWVDPPTRMNSEGRPGQLAGDESYLYVCISTNTWRRIQLLEW